MAEPQLGPVVSSAESVGSTVCYSSVTLHGHEYRVGDCAYFDPNCFTFNVKLPPTAKKSKHDQNETKPVHCFSIYLTSAPLFGVFCQGSYSPGKLLEICQPGKFLENSYNFMLDLEFLVL